MRRLARPFTFCSAVSLLLWAATAAGWLAGAVHATAWPCRARPERTWFIRFERQHLIVSDQQLVPRLLPPPYVIDSTRFREYWLSGPRLPKGRMGLEIDRDSWTVRPNGAGFRRVRTGVGGFKVTDEAGALLVRVDASVRGRRGAVVVTAGRVLAVARGVGDRAPSRPHTTTARAVRRLRLRPPRQPGAVPGVRGGGKGYLEQFVAQSCGPV